MNFALETARLRLRELRLDDHRFVCALLTDRDFLRYIGDRGVRDEETARRYIADGPRASYGRDGFGLWLVVEKATGEPAGICGLLKREQLADVDLGFAFLPDFRGRGIATEASRAVLTYARRTLGRERVVAITNPDNEASIRVLEKVGFRFERDAVVFPDQPALRLYALDGGSGESRAT